MIQGTILVKRVAAIALLFLFTASGGARWILAQGVALPSDQVPPRQSSFYFKGTVVQATEVVGKSAEDVDPGQSAPPKSFVVDLDPRPLTFKGINVGTTGRAELARAWGEPQNRFRSGGAAIYEYTFEPFDKVQVTLNEEMVNAIVIYLNHTAGPQALAEQLKLNDFQPVTVWDGSGQPLGIAFPERGVLFAYEPETDPPQVNMIVLEPLSAEPFILRARSDLENLYERKLHDLDFALKLSPDDAQAHWLRARILKDTGQYFAALESIRKAVQLDEAHGRYRLTWVSVLLETGDYERAVREVKRVIISNKHAPEVRAQAMLLAGNLILVGTNPDYGEAIKFHQEAVKLAAPLVTDERVDVRRTAKQLLIEAHLAIAQDIALGNWKRKQQVVPTWLRRADALARGYIADDQGDPSLRFLVARRSLEAYAELGGKVDTQELADWALREAHKMDANSSDSLYQRKQVWDLSNAMASVLRIEHAQGNQQRALQFGEKAVSLLEEEIRHRDQTPDQIYLIGRTYFLMGSVYAIHKEDHRSAVEWYDKAIELFVKPLPVADQGRMGEWMVSMGVSYWRSGNRDRSVELTENGVELIEKAVSDRQLASVSLAIPYSNLAKMHQNLGNAEEAKRFATMAERLSGPSGRMRRQR